MHVRSLALPARIRALAAALVAGLLLLSLVGCISGDAVQSAFEREFSDDPAVESVDLTTADNMPFTGGVSGTVVLRDDLSDADVRKFVERVREFGVENGGDQQDSRVRIDIEVGDWTFPVLDTTAANDALLDLGSQWRADAVVTSGEVRSKGYRTDVSHVRLVAATPAGIAGLIDGAPAAFAADGMNPSFTLLSTAEESGSVKLTGRMGPWAESAFLAYEALSADIRLTAFEAEEGAITVTLGQESDLDRARSLADAALDPAQTEVFFQSDLLTLFPGARGDEARVLLALLDADARDGLASVWTNDHTVTLTATSIATIEELARTISDNSDAIPLESVTLAIGAGDTQTFSLQEAPGDLAAQTDTAMTVLGRDHVTGLRVNPGHLIDLDVDPSTSDADLAGDIPLLKELSASGERLCVDWTTSTFCVVTAPKIDPDTLRGGAADRGRAFIDAWNSAG